MPVRKMWWCPTCRARIPQPRWINVGKPNQRSYHLVGTIAHDIERVEVLDGDVAADTRASLPATGDGYRAEWAS